MPRASTCSPKAADPPVSGRKLDLIRAIAHPVRICILEELTKGVKCVSDLEEFLDIRQPNVSQHLSLMRKLGIIDYFMDGRLRCYYLTDPFIPDLLNLMKKEYQHELPAPECCPVTKKGTYPGAKEK